MPKAHIMTLMATLAVGAFAPRLAAQDTSSVTQQPQPDTSAYTGATGVDTSARPGRVEAADTFAGAAMDTLRGGMDTLSGRMDTLGRAGMDTLGGQMDTLGRPASDTLSGRMDTLSGGPMDTLRGRATDTLSGGSADTARWHRAMGDTTAMDSSHAGKQAKKDAKHRMAPVGHDSTGHAAMDTTGMTGRHADSTSLDQATAPETGVAPSSDTTAAPYDANGMSGQDQDSTGMSQPTTQPGQSTSPSGP